jgi:sugar phosphate isomerase/epimerase
MTVLGTPYHLGATSYIWPVDIPLNVGRLGPLVDDVELVLFELEEASNLPDEATVASLKALAEAHDLTYTVHLPLDLALTDPCSLEKASKVITRTRDLSPWAYVLHLDGQRVEGSPDASTVSRWRREARIVLEEVVAMTGEPEQLCVENLENYRPEYYLPLLEQVPVNLCIDIGHLWLTGSDPLPFLERHLRRTRVIHLHGVDGHDHQSLLHQGAERVEPVLKLFATQGYDGVVTLEVFNREDFFSSRTLIDEIVNGRG